MNQQQTIAIETIELWIGEIRKGIDFNEAASLISIIEGHKRNLSDQAWKLVGRGTSHEQTVAKFYQLKRDVENHKILEPQNLRLNERGKVTWVDNSDVLVSWKLVKVGAGSQQDVALGNSYAHTVPNQIRQMRKHRVGTYKVVATANYGYLHALEKSSDTREVKLLVNDLGLLKLNKNLETAEDGKPSKIRFNPQQGYFEWDPVDEATSYDVVATISIDVSEAKMGGEYLISELADEKYLSSLENEFQKESLPSEGKWYNAIGKSSSRIFVAVGLDVPRVKLNRFQLVATNDSSTYKPEDYLRDRDKTIYVDIWIIPRAQNTLYVSDVKSYLSPNSSQKKDKNIVIEHAIYSKMLDVFGLPK